MRFFEKTNELLKEVATPSSTAFVMSYIIPNTFLNLLCDKIPLGYCSPGYQGVHFIGSLTVSYIVALNAYLNYSGACSATDLEEELDEEESFMNNEMTEAQRLITHGVN